LSCECDALGKRQFGGVVDGVGGSPHVTAPSIRAGLAAAAGGFLAAERAADFRSGGADVDVDDAAAGAFGGQESLCLALVGGEDAG